MKLFIIPAVVLAAGQYVDLSPERVRGAAPAGPGSAVTWGDSVRVWNMSTLQSRVLASGPFGEGGCVTDLDRDGRPEFVGVRANGLGPLTWITFDGSRTETVDREIETHDCLEAELFERRGVLIVHRGAQVRFYERAAAGDWKSRDIYSIYTPSYQGGLALLDVDGDGRLDILCGNYWIRSPDSFEKPWRLFAIHTWFEEPDSATLRIAVTGARELVAAQAHRSEARIAAFHTPEDATQPWVATPLWPHLRLNRIHGLAVWNGRIAAGENSGAGSRLVLDGEVVAQSDGIVSLVPGRDSLFAAHPRGVSLYRQADRR